MVRAVAASGSEPAAPVETPPDEVTPTKGREWTAFGFSVVVHTFLLATFAVLVIGGDSDYRSDDEALVQIGEPAGQGVGDSVSFDLAPLMPTPQRENLDQFATIAVAKLPPAMTSIGSTDGVDGGGEGGIGTGGPGHGGSGGGTGTGFLNLPRNAVQAGSFAAWTTPQGLDNLNRRFKPKGEAGDSPVPGELYHITIQIKLPRTRTTYSLNDLSGEVVGTDKYRQRIPQGVYVMDADKELTKPLKTGRIDVKKGVVEIVMIVPGAANLVEDTIQIESKLLKETQTLKIRFEE
jgi:hypothetical protein